MFKIIQKNKKTYNEMPQTNRLRWKTLLREGDTFSDQSGWIMCKDFYNDTVAFFKEGTVFFIYGYENNIKKNDEGVYFLLKNIVERDTFLHNLGVINKRLEKDLGCKLEYYYQSEDEVVVLIPNELWESTYRISMITMAIRCANYGVKFDKWEEIWDNKSPAVTLDHAFDKEALKNATELGFKVPKQFEEYWYYAGKEFNSKTNPNPQQKTIIHNNGVCNWSTFMKKAA